MGLQRTGAPTAPRPVSPARRCGTLPPVTTADQDIAVLSSTATQISELAARITDLAERYGTTPDSAVAGELFTAERALATALRSIDRASVLLEREG